jgi:predicted nucleic acid-binding protein
MKIYLDVCCLNRPFDDQTQDRIHLESEAVVIILKHVRSKDWEWIVSEVVDYEIGRIPESSRRQKVESLIPYACHRLALDATILKRGTEIEEIGFGAYDALHLACAEHGNADVFLTTDDQLLRLATEKAEMLAVKVDNPLTWLKGVV